MYKILLVDDERIITEGMSKVIDWKSLGTCLIGTARNGEEALEIIEKENPHIVISDIKMPIMNGLELVSNVYQRFPEIQFILLTGFSEFTYAKKAMEYGVRHYLLKPCNENTVMEAISEICKELDKKVNRNRMMEEMQGILSSIVPFAKEQILKEMLIDEENTKDTEIYEKLIPIERDILTSKEIAIPSEKEEEIFHYDDQKLCQLIKSSSYEEVSREIDNFFSNLSEWQLDLKTTKSYVIRLLFAIIRLCDKQKMNDYVRKLTTLLELENIPQIKSHTKMITKELVEFFQQQQVSTAKHSTIIKRVLATVDEHIGNQDLSLHWVANEKLFMNADYLGKLFKKETGIKFSHYLTNQRMKIAIELIEKETDVKVFEIANQIGYGENPQYFSQVFKKHTGYTPSEYKRESLLG